MIKEVAPTIAEAVITSAFGGASSALRGVLGAAVGVAAITTAGSVAEAALDEDQAPAEEIEAVVEDVVTQTKSMKKSFWKKVKVPDPRLDPTGETPKGEVVSPIDPEVVAPAETYDETVSKSVRETGRQQIISAEGHTL